MAENQARATRMRSKKCPRCGGNGYGCCRYAKTQQLQADSVIAVGFGDAHLSKDGEIVWDESSADVKGWDDLMTVGEAEELASADPDHDWRIVMNGPLRGSKYQRQGEMKWMLVETNEGFA